MVFRKHMKRHQKPYACTRVPGCDKRFGSKSDWKRHENDQHIQLQFWRCVPRFVSDNQAVFYKIALSLTTYLILNSSRCLFSFP
jgi:hypothetical protein